MSGRLTICLAAVLLVGLGVGLAEPARASSDQTPIQLEVSAERRLLWTQQTAEYRVRLNNSPRDFGLRSTTIQYKIINQRADCHEASSWSGSLRKWHRTIILDKWKTKPNYLFLNKSSAIKYLGHKFCFKVSKAATDDHIYLDGYAEVNIEKWWDDVEMGGVCPRVYIWIEDDEIMRGGQSTIHWKITNVRNPVSVHITARNHDYWFYDTSFAEPNIKKQYGNLHEVTSTYDRNTNTITASRTVVGHLPPQTDNLYVIKVRSLGCGCPPAEDATFMYVSD